jgi:hypothetical protein
MAEASDLLRRVQEKKAALTVVTDPKAGEQWGEMSWPGVLDQPARTGRQMLEFVAQQYAKVGWEIGDLKAFWDASPTGELSHVFESYQTACMIYEAERELESH